MSDIPKKYGKVILQRKRKIVQETIRENSDSNTNGSIILDTRNNSYDNSSEKRRCHSPVNNNAHVDTISNQNNKHVHNFIQFNDEQLDDDLWSNISNIIDEHGDFLPEEELEINIFDYHRTFNASTISEDFEKEYHFTYLETPNKIRVQLTHESELTVIKIKGGPRSIENCTYDSENFGTRETDNVISETSENILPPFEMIDLIYLAIKNSPREYVSCNDVQTFIRTWFPYIYKKSWIEDILSTLSYYENYFMCSRPCLDLADIGKSMWTVNNKFLNIFESKLSSMIEKYGNQIKSGIDLPELCTLLNGYNVNYLGYN